MPRGFRFTTILAFAAVWLGKAQTVDTAILGVVTDPAGAAIVNASVTVLQPSTGLSRFTTTGAAGNYEIRYLVPGTYDVEVKAPGFGSQRRAGIELQLSQ